MSPLKKAQKRLALFMDKENASLADCAKILLIDESNLSLFMAQKSGLSTYTENILKVLDSKNKSRNTKKLSDSADMHSLSKATLSLKSAAEKKHIQGLPYKAMNVLSAFQVKFGFNDATASKALGWSVGNICQLRMQFDSGNMGDRAARSLMKRIDNYNHVAANQPARNNPESAATQQNIPSSNQVESAMKSSPAKEPEEPTPTSDDMRELLSTHFETQTGYSIREIQDAADEIDLILSAKRVGAIVRITADLSVGSS